MRRLVGVLCLVVSASVRANGVPPTPPPAATTSAASASSEAMATAGAYGGAGGAGGQGHGGAASNGSMYGGDSNMYILPGPVGGSNLPAGMCQRSDYTHFAIGWNLVSVATGQSHTDLECLQLLGRLEALRRTPVQVKVEIPPSCAKHKSKPRRTTQCGRML